MVIKRVIYTMPFLSVLNSVYLSYTYLEAFMFGNFTDELVSNFASLFFIPIFIIIMVLIIDVLKDKFKINGIKTANNIYLKNLISYILFLILLFFCLEAIYIFLKMNSDKLITIALPTLIEIIIISFAIGKRKEKAVLKIFGYIAFWAYLTIVIFCVTGFFVEYLGYEKLDNSNIKLIFGGIFYHLLNASFLFYSYLPSKIK